MTLFHRLTSARITYPFYSLSVQQYSQKIVITMIADTRILTSAALPCAVSVLKRKLPGVFSTKCFNYKNQPFLKEAAATEIGHLFEHILLDIYCSQKAALGFSNFTIRANTSWNWKKDIRGTFLITFNIHFTERYIFYQALRETINIMELLLKVCTNDHHLPFTPYTSSRFSFYDPSYSYFRLRRALFWPPSFPISRARSDPS